MDSIEPLKAYLNAQVQAFERSSFIASDPIAIPHGFEDPFDREVIGLYAALLAWGRRSTVLNKMEELCKRMGYRPRSFVYHFNPNRDASRLAGFKHRTFQPIDAIWFTQCFSILLREYGSVEFAFSRHLHDHDMHIGQAIQGFSESMLSIHPSVPIRLRKHLARPSTGSACKRINMYLRWMVRPGPVDFGIWKSIQPGQLILPLDVHSGRQARALGMLSRPQNDWKAAQELTQNCRLICPDDPCRYDYAFFGIGATSTRIPPSLLDANKINVTQMRLSMPSRERNAS